jgi:epoxyqueuosine reductase
MTERIDERLDPTRVLPGAQTAICVAMNYNSTPSAVRSDPSAPARGASGQIAQYARSEDYHEFIKQRLYAIADWLRQAVPGAQTKCGVDTAPIAERDLSSHAGVGWVGKNTCVINERIGSWLFLGTVLTTLPLPIDSPAVDRCGTCTRCIDACPTRAITPYQLDARLCISYLTIEHTGAIDEALQAQMGDWLFGCDICQTVCPWNGRAPVAALLELQPRVPARLDAREILNWQKEDFDGAFRRTAVKRIRLPILQRNAAIVVGNQERG